MKELIEALPPEQRRAVEIIRTFIDCYNSADGTGMFSGVARYNFLETRTKISAVQSRDLMGFWSGLRQKMQCPVPPKKADAVITPLWSFDNPTAVLRVLATQAAECIMLARMLHDADKSERKALWKETQEIMIDPNFNDNLEALP